MQRDRIFAQVLGPPKRFWLTTADAARLLDRTPRWVRWLARQGELACELTESGQRLFRRPDVHRYLLQRQDDRARRRPAQLAIARIRMLKAGFEPRQMGLPLWKRPRPTLVQSERALPEAEVKATRSLDKGRGSVKVRYVNRKATVICRR